MSWTGEPQQRKLCAGDGTFRLLQTEEGVRSLGTLFSSRRTLEAGAFVPKDAPGRFWAKMKCDDTGRERGPRLPGLEAHRSVLRSAIDGEVRLGILV